MFREAVRKFIGRLPGWSSFFWKKIWFCGWWRGFFLKNEHSHSGDWTSRKSEQRVGASAKAAILHNGVMAFSFGGVLALSGWTITARYVNIALGWFRALAGGSCFWAVAVQLFAFLFYPLKNKFAEQNKQCAALWKKQVPGALAKTTGALASGTAQKTGVFEERKIWVLGCGDWVGRK